MDFEHVSLLLSLKRYMFAVYHSAYLVPIKDYRNCIDVHVDVHVFGNDLFNV